MTPIQALKKPNEIEFYDNVREKPKKWYANLKKGDSMKFSSLCNNFHWGDTKNWSCELHIMTVIIDGTIPIYYRESFPERYNEVFLTKRTSIKTYNDFVFQNLKISQIKLKKLTLKVCCLCKRQYEKPIFIASWNQTNICPKHVQKQSVFTSKKVLKERISHERQITNNNKKM